MRSTKYQSGAFSTNMEIVALQPTTAHYAFVGPVRDGGRRRDCSGVVQWRQEGNENVQHGVSILGRVKVLHGTPWTGPM